LAHFGCISTREAGVRVVKTREDGIVRRVVLLDDGGAEVVPVTRFLSHLADSNYSPNTLSAYAYDLAHLARFLEQRAIDWNEFRPSTALELLGYRRVREVGCVDLRYEHRRASSEVLLALPDAVAWCWAKGGDWRRRIAPAVTEVRTV